LLIPTDNVDELLGKLEIGRFKPHVFPGRPIKDEAEVNMNDVSPIVDHDVPIMSVLDLQDVADN
jgi:hypothetical protein